MAQAAGALDLSGFWHGLFHYPISQPPVAFTAELRDSDGTLTGATTETGEVGEAAGLTITATLQGRRDGGVTWLKIYDANFRHYDSVRYEGQVSEDGLEIEGRWTVPNNWSGTFLMIRADAVADAVGNTAREPVMLFDYRNGFAYVCSFLADYPVKTRKYKSS